jgi:hypothetical protein
MLLERRSVTYGRSGSWRNYNPVVELADRLDAIVPTDAPLAARHRVLHPFGLSYAGRVSNVLLRFVIPVFLVIVGSAWSGVNNRFLIAGFAGLCGWMLALIGLHIDAPLLTDALLRAANNSWTVFVVLGLAVAGICLAIFFFPGLNGELRIQVLALTALGAHIARSSLTGDCSGGMFKRHRRQIIAGVLTQLLLVICGWLAILMIDVVLPPPPDLDGRRAAVLWVLGLLLVFAGYVATVTRRRQRLYARIISAVDEVLVLIGATERGEPVNTNDALIKVATLDRLLGSSLDLAFLALGTQFESEGLRGALGAVSAKALNMDEASRQPSIWVRDARASQLISGWSTNDCLRHLRIYLVALRCQLQPHEDVLAI